MGFKLKDGMLVDEKGEPVKVGDQTVKLDGVFDQPAIDKMFEQRFARESEKHRKALEDLKSQYEDKLKLAKSPEEIAELEKKLEELNGNLLTKDEQVAQKLLQAKKQFENEVGQHKSEAQKNLELFKSERLNNQILNHAARGRFVDPMDAITQLKPVSVWEDETDEAGKKTGNLVLSFKMTVKDKDGKEMEKMLNAEQAVAALATSKPYMIQGSGTKGWGGGPQSVFTPGQGNQGWREGSPQQKIAAGYGKD